MLKRLTLSAGLTFLGANAMAQDIEMIIGEKTFVVSLNENEAAKDLIGQLPLTLTFENFGQTERIAYLNTPLKLGNAPTKTTPQTGDLTYYIPWDNLAVFVKPFRPSEDLVPLGKMGAEAVEALKASGSHPVTLKVR